MRVIPIPANEDNYQYLIVDKKTKQAAIVDPVDVDAIYKTVDEAGVQLTTALVTHHHWDHAGGTKALSEAAARRQQPITLLAGDGERVDAVDKVISDGDTLTVGESLRVHALTTPCHTSTHVCYYVEEAGSERRAVFTGDTLFIGGCGRFFEGTAEQMDTALNCRLAGLPDDTAVYCGHEYTVANLKFAHHVEPHNVAVDEKLKWAEVERQAGRPTVPSTIGAEKTFNPFMRVGNPELQKTLNASNSIDAMQKLRDQKNNFKG